MLNAMLMVYFMMPLLIQKNSLNLLQKIVGLAVSHVVEGQSGSALSKPSLMSGYQETRQLMLEFDAMHQFLSVHDPSHEQFSVWWAYEPKRDLVLGETSGGWQLFQLRRGQRLGRMSTLAVSLCVRGSCAHVHSFFIPRLCTFFTQ